MSYAVVMCIEKGSLEYKGLCLLVTLRRYWTSFKDVPIYIYSPRQGKEVSPWLVEAIEKLGAIHVPVPLNEKYHDYPLANKPISMAHAEELSDCEYLIFLDSDILCWRDPMLFQLPADKDLAMTVDTTKAVASSGASDPYDHVWMDLYKKAGVSEEIYVTTSLTDERVRCWMGSGVIIARRSAGLMKKWMELFNAAMSTTPFAQEMTYLREQMTISALAASVWPRFLELPITYNYQVQNYDHFTRRGNSPEDAILWHYQPYFNKAFRKFSERLDKIPAVGNKIHEAEKFSEKLRTNYKKMIGLDESWIMKLRSRLKIRTRARNLLTKVGF